VEQGLEPVASVSLVVDSGGVVRSVELTPEVVAVGWTARRDAAFANALLARLDADLAGGSTPDLAADQLRRAVLQLELGDAEAAVLAARSARLEHAWGFGRGTSLYYQGLAALAAGRAQEARRSLREALGFPLARASGPQGVPLMPVLEKLHRQALEQAPVEETVSSE
jgi:hypothetical protein